MRDIMQYCKSENFKYLVIEASHGDYYGFNTKVKEEREIATEIVSEYDDIMVKGWKESLNGFTMPRTGLLLLTERM